MIRDKLNLEYFDLSSEFIRGGIDWSQHMAVDLLVKLDVFRHMLKAPVIVSPNDLAIGRELGPDNESDHNIQKWGLVLGIDLMIPSVKSEGEAYDTYLLARRLGFTGIGFYPNWHPYPGFHLGVRRNRRPGQPATWGFVVRNSKKVQVSIMDAIESMPETA